MGQPAHSHTVLVVEDDGIVRLDAAQSLESAGYQVVEAGDASEALEILAHRSDIDVLFTDINMPGGMDGLELARVVHRTCPEVRLIVTSGAVRPAPGQIPDCGAFLPKPYSPDSIARAVDRQLAA
ncbi:MAG: response regulator [Caulobacteraceae bacterium]|nr:response regulator [Caulobacteraceae bacterium]